MRAFLTAVAEAIRAAFQGTWRIVDGVWTWVRSVVPGADPAMPIGDFHHADESKCRGDDAPESDLVAGIREWAGRRSRGEIGPLPRGVSATVAGWAASISRVEAETIATAPVDRIRQHLDGAAQIRGVRTVPVVTRDQAQAQAMADAVKAAMEKPVQVSDLAARKAARAAEIRAARARTRERYEERQAASAALAI